MLCICEPCTSGMLLLGAPARNQKAKCLLSLAPRPLGCKLSWPQSSSRSHRAAERSTSDIQRLDTLYFAQPAAAVPRSARRWLTSERRRYADPPVLPSNASASFTILVMKPQMLKAMHSCSRNSDVSPLTNRTRYVTNDPFPVNVLSSTSVECLRSPASSGPSSGDMLRSVLYGCW